MESILTSVTDVTVVNRIDKFLNDHYNHLLENLEKDEVKQEKIEFEVHRDRIKLCAQYVSELIKNEKPADLLVIGDKTIIDTCLHAIGAYDNVNVTFTDFELRSPFPYPDNSFDLVVNLEVFEHIKDVEGSQRDLFMFTGAYCFIGQCNRVLKPGKKMLLSTPNACSLKALCRIFQHKHPFAYNKHVREYTPKELTYILEVCNFDVELLETHDVWSNINGQLNTWNDEQNVNWAENKSIMEDILKTSPYAEEYRGDDIFLIARRMY
jgi:predicted SAM-dependent methyltransferase